MMQAFVLMNIKGDAKKIVAEVKNTPGVVEAYLITGLHDIIAKIEAEDLYKLRDVITDRLLKIEGIQKTITMIVVDGQ